MPTGIDHIVIAVRDLAETSRDYTSAGFTVVPGGEHKSGASHNALVAFQDGTYFELIAFRDLRDPDTGPWASALRESGEGLVDFALRTDDLDLEVDHLTQNGLHVVGPLPGGRVRPDGQRLDWRTIRFTEPSLPFYCHDETERSLRVPGGDAAIHANGVTGVSSIAIPVADLRSAGETYRKLTGVEGTGTGHRLRFSVGNQAIDLIDGPGSRPLEVILVGGTGDIDQVLTHGARLRVVS